MTDEWGIPPTRIRRSPTRRGDVPLLNEAERSRESIGVAGAEGNAEARNLSFSQLHGLDGEDSRAAGEVHRGTRTSGAQAHQETGGGESSAVFSKRFASLT